MEILNIIKIYFIISYVPLSFLYNFSVYSLSWFGELKWNESDSSGIVVIVGLVSGLKKKTDYFAVENSALGFITFIITTLRVVCS